MHVYKLVTHSLEKSMKMILSLIASSVSSLLKDKQKTSKAGLRVHRWLLLSQVTDTTSI